MTYKRKIDVIGKLTHIFAYFWLYVLTDMPDFYFVTQRRIGQTKKVTIIKMVSKDTVDEDIYMMQQRKAKMNAVIMGSETYKKTSAKDTKQVLETAVNRFLQSPPTSKKDEISSAKEKSVEFIEIL